MIQGLTSLCGSCIPNCRPTVLSGPAILPSCRWPSWPQLPLSSRPMSMRRPAAGAAAAAAPTAAARRRGRRMGRATLCCSAPRQQSSRQLRRGGGLRQQKRRWTSLRRGCGEGVMCKYIRCGRLRLCQRGKPASLPRHKVPSMLRPSWHPFTAALLEQHLPSCLCSAGVTG